MAPKVDKMKEESESELETTVGTSEAIQSLKKLTENFFVRKILRSLTSYCERDKANRLEVALELYTGVRKDACFKCKTAEKLLKPVIEKSAKTFGVTPEGLKEKFKEAYWRRGLVNVIKGISFFGVQRPFVPGTPFQVVWNITKACNLRCKHCYEKAGKPASDELNTEEAIKGIDILADAGVVILAFSGGEPTVRPDILKLVRHASEREIYVAMATNGTLLSKERVNELKEAGLQFVQISLDGSTSETHDSFRGTLGTFEKTVQGIKNCVEQGLFVEIATTVTKHNLAEVPSLIELAEKLGVNWFMHYNFVPVGRGKEIVALDLSPEEREQLLKTLWEEMKKRKIEVLSTAPQFSMVALMMEGADSSELVMPTHFYNPHLGGQLNNLAEFIGGCGAGRFYISIEPNGDMYPCVFFPHEQEVKIGNLLKDDFEDLWRNSPILKTLRNKDILYENCGSCVYRYVCGGCRARAYNYFHDLKAPDPGCTLNKEHYRRLVTQINA